MTPLDDFRFESDGLCFRPLAAGDGELFRACYTDPAVMRFVGPPFTRAQATVAFDRVLARLRGDPLRSVFLTLAAANEPDQPFGLCGVPRWRSDCDRLELGILLLPAAWGKRYSCRALAALTGRIFAVSRAAELRLVHTAANIALARAAAGAGYAAIECTEEVGAQALRIRAARRSTWVGARQALANGSDARKIGGAELSLPQEADDLPQSQRAVANG